MNIWGLFGIICAAGAVGGLINALLTDKGFSLPQRVKVGAAQLYTPGIFGNILISAVAAGTSWSLYGPLARYISVGPIPDGVKQPTLNLSMYELGGALLVGIAGAKWLTSESEKSLLKASVVKAATSPPNTVKAQAMTFASASQVAEIADSL